MYSVAVAGETRAELVPLPLSRRNLVRVFLDGSDFSPHIPQGKVAPFRVE
jgi:hypothetical protein